MVNATAATVEGDFTDPSAVWFEFLKVLNAVPGVTIVGMHRTDFPGGGMTGVVVIAESHAAIHTWPELNRAWVELATCGSQESIAHFQRAIDSQWRPTSEWQLMMGRP